MSKEKIIVSIVGAVVIIVGGILFFSSSTNPEALPAPSPAADKQLIRDDSHILGKKDVKTTLVEFGDYQCPACGAAYPFTKQILAKYGTDTNFSFTFRNFPLTSLHKNANSSAFAAEAAGKQGKFWEMHDWLYEHQNEWSEQSDPNPFYITAAQSLGLNIDQFNKDRSDRNLQLSVIKDASDGLGYNINSTPTFFLNGEKVELQTFTELPGKIDAAMQKQ